MYADRTVSYLTVQLKAVKKGWIVGKDLKGYRAGGKGRERDLPFTGSLAADCNGQHWARPKPGPQGYLYAFHVRRRGPNAWPIFHGLSRPSLMF